MATEIGPEQEEHLEALSTARDRLQQAQAVEDEATRHFRSLIRAGKKKSIDAAKLAQASGLSVPRIYQLLKQSDENAQASAH